MKMITNKPEPGDVISVNRGLYRHYGVYVGNNTVVHFGRGDDYPLSPRDAYIKKVSLNYFTDIGPVRIETRCGTSFTREETVRRALAAVGSGKGRYSLTFNNCEHFANWCRYGKKRSSQVEHFATVLAGTSVLILGTALITGLCDELEAI